MRRWRAPARLFASLVLFVAATSAMSQAPKDNDAGPYVPTPWPIVDELLKLADIRADDVVYDLGSGDGRLVLTAARRFGARGVGIELQKRLVDQANAEAAREGFSERVRFVQQDLFESRFNEASVVTLYLLPRFVTRLVPRLRADLKPGSRIVSHDYPLTPWPADKTLSFEVDEKVAITGSRRTVLYYYIVPARVGGEWDFALPRGLLPEPAELRLRQEIDSLEGTVRVGSGTTEARDLSVRGDRIRFGLLSQGRLLAFTGSVTSSTMQGEVSVSGTTRRESWSAKLRSPSP